MRTLLAQVLACGLGGFVGAILRFGATLGIQKLARGPYATLTVNLLGCLVLGLLLGASQDGERLSPEARSFLAVGVLGSFTTFSTFSGEAVELLRERQHLAAAGYVLLSVVLGLLLFAGGHELALRWSGGAQG
ncbi:MAG: fluoride efflux transporter CrcB [Planctomycetota bacterium]